MKMIIKLLLLALLIRYVPKFCHEQTDGFAISKIHANIPQLKKWEIPTPTHRNLAPIFDQRFHYLSSGGQCYVFVSDDQKYVIKFFKMHRRRLHFIVKNFPLWGKYAIAREKQRLKRKRKLHRDFDSYKLAYEELRKETGLVFVQINTCKGCNLTAKIVDKLKIEHLINLDEVGFILQRKATLASSLFLQPTEDKEKIKERIALISNLILSRCRKGIHDGDNKIHRNIGFIDDEPILIDVGRLIKDPLRKDPEVQKADLNKSLQRFQAWLDKE